MFLKFLISTMGIYLPAQSIAIGCLVSLFYSTKSSKEFSYLVLFVVVAVVVVFKVFWQLEGAYQDR